MKGKRRIRKICDFCSKKCMPAPELLEVLQLLVEVCSRKNIKDAEAFYKEFDERVENAKKIIDKILER